MGFFSMTPKSKSEAKAYALEKAKAEKVYTAEKSKARMDQLKKQARFDAQPRAERAKQRLAKGFGAVKSGIGKLQAFEAKAQAREKAMGNSGGLIQQGFARDRQMGAQSQPLLQRSMQGPQGDGFIQRSMTAPQGEGLIVQSLRGPQTNPVPSRARRRKKR